MILYYVKVCHSLLTTEFYVKLYYKYRMTLTDLRLGTFLLDIGHLELEENFARTIWQVNTYSLYIRRNVFIT